MYCTCNIDGVSQAGWCTAVLHNSAETIRSIQLPLTRSRYCSPSRRVRTCPAMPKLTWIIAKQGMVQTTVREWLPRHLLWRRYIPELRANGEEQAKSILPAQLPCRAKTKAFLTPYYLKSGALKSGTPLYFIVVYIKYFCVIHEIWHPLRELYVYMNFLSDVIFWG